MQSSGLVSGGGNPITVGSVNSVRQGFDEREQKIQVETDRKDQEMMRVFEFAGDGYVDEAKYYAQSKGLEVPPQIYDNATFAKGLSLAGKIYGNDKAAAQRFTQGFMQSNGDLNVRLQSGQMAAGDVVNAEDRQFERQIALEQWKMNNKPAGSRQGDFTLNGSRYTSDGKVIVEGQPDNGDRVKFVQDGVSSALNSGLTKSDQIPGLVQELNNQFDMIQPSRQQQNQPVTNNNPIASAPQNTMPQAPTTPAVNNLPAGLPQGSRMIGTSGGKPVYEAPNGERFIDDGNT